MSEKQLIESEQRTPLVDRLLFVLKEAHAMVLMGGDKRTEDALDLMRTTLAVAEQKQPALSIDAYPDGAPADEVLAYLAVCASSWEPGARIIGNLRAGDILRALGEQKQPEPHSYGSPPAKLQEHWQAMREAAESESDDRLLLRAIYWGRVSLSGVGDGFRIMIFNEWGEIESAFDCPAKDGIPQLTPELRAALRQALEGAK